MASKSIFQSERDGETTASHEAASSHLIVTVHGIRTFGQWQERLETLIGWTQSPGIDLVNYKFGYFSVIAFILPFSRWLVVRRFKKELLRLATIQPRSRIDLVGHSFGTHIIGWTAHSLKAKIDFHTIILAGSVLRAGFPWNDLIAKSVQRVVCDCGTKDVVLLLSQFLILFTGMAGRTGFSGSTSTHFRNRYSAFGHSGYFQDALGAPSDEYMKKHWLPLLVANDPIELFDQRTGSTLDGFITFLGNNAEPIKLCLYSAPFVLLSWLFYHLYAEAKFQRDAALRNQSHFLASLSRDSSKANNYTLGSLLALAALPTTRRVGRPLTPEATGALFESSIANREVGVLNAEDVVMALSPDSSTVATGTGLSEGAIFWDLKLGKAVGQLPGGPYSDRLTYSPNGKLLATAGHGKLALWDLQTKSIRFGPFETGTVYSLSFSPDGRLLAIGTRNNLRVLNLSSGLIRRFPWETDRVLFVDFSRDGKLLASADSVDARVWNVTTDELMAVFERDSNGGSVAFSPDGRTLAMTNFQTYEITLFDIPSKASRLVLNGHSRMINEIVFSPDGTKLASASNDMTIRVWDVESGYALKILSGHTDPVKSVAFSNDGHFLVSGSQDKTIRLWNIQSGATVALLAGHQSGVSAVSFTPDDKMIISSSRDKTIRLWDARLRDLLQDEASVRTLIFLGRETLASETSAHTVSVWNLSNGQKRRQIKAIEGGMIRISPFGLIAAEVQREKASLFDALSGKELSPIKSSGRFSHFGFSPNGALLAIEMNRSVIICDSQTASTCEELETDQVHQEIITYVVFSNDGHFLLTASDDGKLVFWKVDHGHEKLWEREGQQPLDIAFSTDDQTVAVAAGEEVQLYELQGGRVRSTFSRGVGSFTELTPHIAFSPTGDALAFSSGTQVQLQSLTSGVEGIKLGGHDRVVTAMAFSPTAHVLATASADGTVRLWESETGQLLAVLRELGGPVTSIAFSSDGTTLASGTSGGAVRLWKIPPIDDPYALIEFARSRLPVGRSELSADEKTAASLQ